MNCLKCLLALEGINGCYGMHSECFTKWFKVPNSATFTSITRRDNISNEDNLDIIPQNNSFFHGKFKKYSAILDGRSFILKMRQPEAPELPEVEYLCNQIGEELGIPVAKFYIINFEHELVFVTENFVHRYVQEDLKHIYHFRDGRQHNCKDLISIVREKTQRPFFVTILVNTILFDALVGNHDRHGRNLGFLISHNNTILAPIYDNVSALSLESGDILKCDLNPLGCIYTEHSKEPSMRDYVKELRRLGFEREVARFFSGLTISGMKKINFLIENSFCSPLMKQAMKKLIEKRYKELQDEWES